MITGLNGMHYEIWINPTSLSYYKFRIQETGLWYAQDGSRNDGGKRTSKRDWCTIILIHGIDILVPPKACAEETKDFVETAAGIAPKDKAAEVARTFLAELGEQGQPSAVAANLNDIVSGSFNKVANRLTVRSAGGAVGGAAAGAVVATGVAIGVDATKKALNLQGRTAAGIAADIITTNALNTGLTSLIMWAAGGGFNPVTAGVGLIYATAEGGTKALLDASDDTMLKIRNRMCTPEDVGPCPNPRLNKDLNGLSELVHAPYLLEKTYEWDECAREGQRCEFSGVRAVRYGVNPREKGKYIEKAAWDALDCNTGAFGKDPNPGVAKRCFVPLYKGEQIAWIDCGGEGEICHFIGTKTVMYGADDKWKENKNITNGTDCDYRRLGDTETAKAKNKRCFLLLPKNEVPEWIDCGGEGEKCHFTGTRLFRYGANGRFVVTTAKDGADCDYRKLGDPLPGKAKRCSVQMVKQELRNWSDCAGEGARCSFTDVKVFRYGASGRYVFKIAKDGADCDYRKLGDPAPGVTKRCSVQADTR